MSFASGIGNSITGIASGLTGLANLGGGLVMQNKAAKSANPTTARNPYTEAQAMLAAQTGTAQDQYDAYAKYLGQYAGIDSSVSSQQFGDSVNMYGKYNAGIDALNNASNTAYRAGTIADVDQYGQQVRDQYLALNPELYASLNNLSSQSATASPYETYLGKMATDGGGTAGRLETMLGTQAESDLALGGALSNAELRTAAQAARRAGAARGLYDSNNTIGAEILDTYALSNQRLNERRQFASDTAGLLRTGRAADAALLSGAEAMGNQRFNNATTAANAWTANRYDPYAGILGASSGNQLSSYGIAGLNASAGAYNRMATRDQFDPYNSYANAIYGGNYDAQNRANLAKAGIYNATTQQLIGNYGTMTRDSFGYMGKGADQIGDGLGQMAGFMGGY